MGPWQPIDTAPKDGTRVLLYRATAHASLYIVIGFWDLDRGHPYWSHDAEHELGVREARKFQPTHWMPLPELPADSGSDDPHSIDDLNRVGHPKHYRRRWTAGHS